MTARTLKEQLDLDTSVFLNPNEFGEVMIIDGMECVGIWSEEAQPVQKFESDVDIMGIFSVSRVLSVKAKDPQATLVVPEPYQEIMIDAQAWTVRDVQSETGIIKLTIFRNAS